MWTDLVLFIHVLEVRICFWLHHFQLHELGLFEGLIPTSGCLEKCYGNQNKRLLPPLSNSTSNVLEIKLAVFLVCIFSHLSKVMKSMGLHHTAATLSPEGLAVTMNNNYDVGSWSFLGSNVPVRNESTMK